MGLAHLFWREISGAGLGSDEASLITRAQEVARQNGIFLVLPLYTIYPDTAQKSENKFVMIDPIGEIEYQHVKYGGNIFEGTLKGDGKMQAVTTPFGVLSGVICYDMDYPAVIRQTGQNGTSLRLIPSKDWRAIDPAHSHMAVFSAIENGMSIVRQVDTGLSIAVDPFRCSTTQRPIILRCLFTRWKIAGCWVLRREHLVMGIPATSLAFV